MDDVFLIDNLINLFLILNKKSNKKITINRKKISNQINCFF